ncbi:MAG: hypothetical protein QOJ64_4512 [Acidobacteriota bacterium]|nr:hypothetical protein [Acidobacteriota bacterium]
MNTNRCSCCGFLNFTTAESCKRCKAEFTVPVDSGYANYAMAPQGAYQTTPAWLQTDYHQQYAPPPYFAGPIAPLPRVSRHGSTNAVLWTLLAITLVIAFAIGVIWRSNKPVNYVWQEYHPADNSYSATMPTKPVESIERRASPVGELQMHLSVADMGPEGAFLVGYADYPENFSNLSPDSVLDAGANGAVANSGATLLNKKRITLDGYQGLELEMQPPSGAIRGGGRSISRMYWVAPRIYILFAGGPASSNTDAAIAKFLDSFKLRRR